MRRNQSIRSIGTFNARSAACSEKRSSRNSPLPRRHQDPEGALSAPFVLLRVFVSSWRELGAQHYPFTSPICVLFWLSPVVLLRYESTAAFNQTSRVTRIIRRFRARSPFHRITE